MDNWGYFKIWRKIKDHPIKTDGAALLVFIDLLINAEWTDGRQIFFKKEQITLRRGQLTVGRFQLAKNTGLKPSTAWDALRRLSTKYKITDTQTDTKYSLVTILNFERYQQIKNQPDTQTDSTPTGDRQHADTLKSFKHLSIKNKTLARTATVTDDQFIQTLKNNPAYKGVDIDIELGKMDAWLSTRPTKKKTRRFIVNWLNRVDRPVSNGSKPTIQKTKRFEKCFICSKEFDVEFLSSHRAKCAREFHEKNPSPLPKVTL